MKMVICVYVSMTAFGWVKGGGASLKKIQILCFVSKVISWIITSTSAQTTSQQICFQLSNLVETLRISGIWILRFCNVLWLKHESILIHISTKTINTEIYIYFISTYDGHQFVYFIKGFVYLYGYLAFSVVVQ